MKRFIYIAIVAVGFLAVSCGKETIKPTAQNGQEVPVWRSASDDGDSDDGTSDGGSLTVGSIGDDTIGDDNSTGGITDPNNDKDESTRKKN